jgi:polysaccharide biosynthesis/export protein
MMNRKVVLSCMLLTVVSALGAEDAALGAKSATIDAMTPNDKAAALAMVTPDYMVTPGDVYMLSYLTSEGYVVFPLTVAMDYSVSISTLGKMNLRSIAFPAAKEAIEGKIRDSFAFSSPQLIIKSVGVFNVFVEGEVLKSAFLEATSLMRLSDLWQGTTAVASYRDIRITARDGASAVFDLFRFWRDGDLSQNPRLRPGDTIKINMAQRTVSVNGEVNRPGAYQLLPGDGLKELISRYGHGLNSRANPERITLFRYIPGKEKSGEGQILRADDDDPGISDLDVINIMAVQELRPLAFFDGALGTAGTGGTTQISRRIEYPFSPGETLVTAVQRMRGEFTTLSDVRNAFIVRKGERIPVDIGRFIFDHDYSGDLPLEPNDNVIVPFRQFSVAVSGAVMLPGRYPYIPGRTWSYYVNLAGGADKEKNSGNQLYIEDGAGARFGKDRIVEPDDSIYLESNNFFYGFGKAAAILSVVISIATFALNWYYYTVSGTLN